MRAIRIGFAAVSLLLVGISAPHAQSIRDIVRDTDRSYQALTATRPETTIRPNPFGGYDSSNGISSRPNPVGGFDLSNGVSCRPNALGGMNCR